MDVLKEFNRVKNLWVARQDRIVEWYKQRLLEDKNAQQDFESVVVNDPKTFFKLAMHVLCAAPNKMTIPIMAESQVERDGISRSERAVNAWWREADARQVKRGRRPWRWEFYDLLCMTGWYAVFCAVMDDGKGNPLFVADIWNPQFAYPDFDGDNLYSLGYEYRLPATAVKKKAKAQGWGEMPRLEGAEQVTLRLLWYLEDGGPKQAIMIGDKIVRPYGKVAGFDDTIPVFIGAVGGEASWGGYGEGDADWTSRYGESILEASRLENDAINKWESLMMDETRRIIHPLTIDRSRGGRANITAKDIMKSEVLHVDEDVVIGELIHQPLPREVAELRARMEARAQHAMFPSTMYGSLNLPLSGYAVQTLMTAAHAVVGEQKKAGDGLMEQISHKWLSDYKVSGLKPIQRAVRVKGKPGFVVEDFSPDDVPDGFIVVAQAELATPTDRMERMQAARAARPQGDLLDHTSVLETILQEEDAQLVFARLAEDQVRLDPDMQEIEKIRVYRGRAALLRKQGDEEAAQILEEVANAILTRMSAPKPGGAAPPARPRVSPEVMPPEMMGLEQAAQQVATGTPPPQGRPPTTRGLAGPPGPTVGGGGVRR